MEKVEVVDSDDKESAKYLADLALTSPQQLPLAVLEAMRQRLILTITNRLKEAAEASFSQFEEQLRRALDNNDDKEGH